MSAGEHLRRMGWLCEHFETTHKELAKSKRKAEDWTDDMMNIFVIVVGIIVVIAIVAMMAIVAVRAMSALM